MKNNSLKRQLLEEQFHEDQQLKIQRIIEQLESQQLPNRKIEDRPNDNQMLMLKQMQMLQNNVDCGQFQIGSSGITFPSPGRPSQGITDLFWGLAGVGLCVAGVGLAIGFARKN